MLKDRLAQTVASVGSVDTDLPIVALTFDDGPDPDVTPVVFDALAGAGMHATFFVLGSRAREHAALVRRAVDAGHEVALHAAEHRYLPGQSLRGLRDQIWRAKAALEAVAGTEVRWFRPPYGRQDLRAYAVARLAGLRVAAWSAAGGDWLDQPPATSVDRWLAETTPGSIVLLHDGLAPAPSDSTWSSGAAWAEAVNEFVAALSARNLRSVTLSDLVRGGRARSFPWFVPGRGGLRPRPDPAL